MIGPKTLRQITRPTWRGAGLKQQLILGAILGPYEGHSEFVQNFRRLCVRVQLFAV